MESEIHISGYQKKECLGFHISELAQWIMQDAPHLKHFRSLIERYCRNSLRGHPYMTSALRGGGGLAQKKM